MNGAIRYTTIFIQIKLQHSPFCKEFPLILFLLVEILFLSFDVLEFVSANSPKSPFWVWKLLLAKNITDQNYQLETTTTTTGSSTKPTSISKPSSQDTIYNTMARTTEAKPGRQGLLCLLSWLESYD